MKGQEKRRLESLVKAASAVWCDRIEWNYKAMRVTFVKKVSLVETNAAMRWAEKVHQALSSGEHRFALEGYDTSEGERELTATFSCSP